MYSIIKSSPVKVQYSFYGEVDQCDYSFTDGKEVFYIGSLKSGDYQKTQQRLDRKKLAEKIKQLRRNDYKFIKFFCHIADHPFDLINYVYSKGFEFDRKELITEKDNYFEFKGDILDDSCLPFYFRVYDKSLVEKIKKLL